MNGIFTALKGPLTLATHSVEEVEEPEAAAAAAAGDQQMVAAIPKMGKKVN